MGYKIVKIIIPGGDIQYEIGYNNVCEIHESFKQVSNDSLKSIYVVKLKRGSRFGFIEISADAKGIIVYKEYHSYIDRKRKIKQHIRHHK